MERFVRIIGMSALLLTACATEHPPVALDPRPFVDSFTAAFDQKYPDRPQWTRLWAYGSGTENVTHRSFSWVAWSDKYGIITVHCNIALVDETARRFNNEKGEWYMWRVEFLHANALWLPLRSETTMIHTDNGWIMNQYSKSGCNYEAALAAVIDKVNATGTVKLARNGKLEVLLQNAP